MPAIENKNDDFKSRIDELKTEESKGSDDNNSIFKISLKGINKSNESDDGKIMENIKERNDDLSDSSHPS